ncbi:MAG: iron-sulfur cluster assembly scaffold protein [Thermoanaerobaculales bacterium]
MAEACERERLGVAPQATRQEIVDFLLEQAASPSHNGKLDPCDVTMVGGNPGCGDVITVYLNVDRDRDAVAQASFVGEGCTISQAAASVLMDQVQGLTLTAIEAMDANDVTDSLGREVVKSRPRCATLALSTLKGAVKAYRNQRLREAAGIR